MKYISNWVLVFGISIVFFASKSYSQITVFGAENHSAIKVTASSASNQTKPENIINGSGKDAAKMEAGRFLAQASFGYKLPELERVVSIGFEPWIDEQFELPTSSYYNQISWIWPTVLQMRLDAGIPEEEIFGPRAEHFNYAWWQNITTSEDQLRHRIAFALSQILVISSKSDLLAHGDSMASYYDVLYNNAFGNYYDLLLEVSLHPAMGYFLSHLNNPKADDKNVIRPDENYARELMQLFTIGLHQLNQNGTVKIENDGRPLPTYDADDIRELAQVFTGLGPGAIAEDIDFINEPYFGLGFWGMDWNVPMVMYDDFHDQSSKELINGLILPPNQSGMQDIEDAIRHIFNHPNVGPFLARILIQRLVKSNPSPNYIFRVASAFNNNGNGIRGDMKAVIKAILLDEEARSCSSLQNENHGKLKEPILKFAQLVRSFDLISPLGRYWNASAGYLEWTGQMTLSAPSVFNFYEPDHQPPGILTTDDLYGPEFKILNAKTAIGYINEINAAIMWNTLIRSWETDYGDEIVRLNTSIYEDKADDIESVINDFDILLTNGQLTDFTRDELRTASNGLLWGDLNFQKVRMALYGLMISADYNIFK